jgi:hypothetical protein
MGLDQASKTYTLERRSLSAQKEFDILDSGSIPPRPPRNTKTTFGWFFHLVLRKGCVIQDF